MAARLRLTRVESRTFAGVPRLRLTRVAARVAAAAPVLAPMPSVTADAGATVTLTAQVASGAPDSYTWRVISGPGVLLGSDGPTRTMVAPGTLNGTAVTVGVRGVVGGAPGLEVTSTVTVRPHSMFVRSGGSWAPGYWRAALALFGLAASGTAGLYDLVPGGADVRALPNVSGIAEYDMPAGSGLTQSGTYPGLYEGI